jgi:endo-1,4-beta-xylanase
VVDHYRGKVFAWDVVNEAFDEGRNTGKLRSTLWYDKPGIGLADKGYAYIESCFRWAHAADPDALLFYNDVEAEAMNAKSDAIYAMVKDFRSRGVPIDGVGLQMHLSNLHPHVASISENIGRLTALGLKVHITELDVSLPVDANGNASTADLQSQGDVYRQIASACLSHAGCTAIQTWGFTDKYSWIPWFTKHARGAALPFDREYHPEFLGEYAARKATIPWFAIGGIDTANVSSVIAAGARRIVVVRAIRDANDPEAAARSLRESLEAGVGARS